MVETVWWICSNDVASILFIWRPIWITCAFKKSGKEIWLWQILFFRRPILVRNAFVKSFKPFWYNCKFEICWVRFLNFWSNNTIKLNNIHHSNDKPVFKHVSQNTFLSNLNAMYYNTMVKLFRIIKLLIWIL